MPQLIQINAAVQGNPQNDRSPSMQELFHELHRSGLGTVLMKHLIEVARVRGILFMVSIDSVENLDMDDLARHLGFSRRIDPDDATLAVHSLWLQP
jgi:hypothetical protein